MNHPDDDGTYWESITDAEGNHIGLTRHAKTGEIRHIEAVSEWLPERAHELDTNGD